jgi:hypothetical protein
VEEIQKMKNILKISVIVIMSVALVACSASNLSNRSAAQLHAAKLANISSEKLIDQCQDPVEVYNLKERNLHMKVNFARHHKCMGIDEMIVIAWPGHVNGKILNSIRVLAISWAEWTAKKLGGKVAIKVTELKVDVLRWEGQTINVAYFEVKRGEK